MKIVKLGPEHFEQDIKLSCYAFQKSLTEQEFNERMKKNKRAFIMGIFDEETGKLASKLHIRPLSVWIGVASIKMGGISSVATYPEYRRKGHARDLIIRSLQVMKENGQLISILHPFSFDFYRKFGWEFLSEYLQATLSKGDLKFVGNVSGKVRFFSEAMPMDDITMIYKHHATKHIGMLDRELDWWEDYKFRDKFCAVYYDECGHAKGYILYDIRQSKMTVQELVCMNHAARLALWNYICQHDSMVDVIEMNLDQNDPMLFSILDPKLKAQRKAFGMARIVDVKEFLKVYPFCLDNVTEEVVIHVEDEHAPWNTGRYAISKGEGMPGNSVELDQDNSRKSVHMTINSLTALLFGVQNVEQLQSLGMLHGEEKHLRLLNGILPKLKPNIYDGF